MYLTKCINGHFYDKDKYSLCPNCELGLDNTCLKKGTILKDKYTIIECIGKGGTSIVYKAIDNNNHIYAIKELFPTNCKRNFTTNEIIIQNHSEFNTFKEHYIKQSKKFKFLNNTNATSKMYSTFEENNTMYMVMDFISGYSLEQLIYKDEFQQNYELKMQIIYCILYNTKKLHDKHVLIVDISPGNFIINDGNVLFSDLGNIHIASQKDSKTYAYSFTTTSKYAPPEIYQPKVSQNLNSDIYSIAAVAYMILTGNKFPSSIDRLLNTDNTLISYNNVDTTVKKALAHALELDNMTRTPDIDVFIKELFGYSSTSLPVPNYKEISASIIQLFNNTKVPLPDTSTTIPLPQKATTDMDRTISSIFYDIGIDPDDVEKVDISEIPKETQSYKMLMNQFKAVSQKYDESCLKVTELEKKLEDKKNSTVMMTIGEIVLSLGTIFIHDLSPQSIITVLAGILITVYALYLNFRDKT
ncbi:MAG: hypothetical protein HFG34_04730 [Eubacterium sp.]|nr:hypothetical protein [Eubacterium sp.]